MEIGGSLENVVLTHGLDLPGLDFPHGWQSQSTDEDRTTKTSVLWLCHVAVRHAKLTPLRLPSSNRCWRHLSYSAALAMCSIIKGTSPGKAAKRRR